MDQILSRLDMVNVLASMVSRSTEKIRREIAVDLGYGYAEPASIGAKRKPVVSPLPTPAPPAVGARPSGQGPIEEVLSIQVVEASERKKWGLRLQNICERAGAASGLNDAKRCAGLLPAEAARLKSLAFEEGCSAPSGRMFDIGRSLKSGRSATDCVCTRPRSWQS